MSRDNSEINMNMRFVSLATHKERVNKCRSELLEHTKNTFCKSHLRISHFHKFVFVMFILTENTNRKSHFMRIPFLSYVTALVFLIFSPNATPPPVHLSDFARHGKPFLLAPFLVPNYSHPSASRCVSRLKQ